MPRVTTADGVDLYYEETGSGSPICFVHEFAGDFRSWEHQVRFFSRRHRCITFNARGYPPSDIPPDPNAYSQEHARDDVLTVLDALSIDAAHIVGCSMGAFATVHVGLHAPHRTRSLTAAGVGYGALAAAQAAFRVESRALADDIETRGTALFAAEHSATSPGRVAFGHKDPRGHAEFVRMLAEHSPVGSANTMRGVQAQRPSFTELEADLRTMQVPLLIVAGDEDEPSLDASLFLKRTVSSAALSVFPKSGHAMNLEEPARFNDLLADFIATVEAGAWQARDLPQAGDRII